MKQKEAVNHPAHYGGDTTYEVIKVLDAWDLGFCLGNTVKYIARAGKKGSRLEDLKKAAWYLGHEIEKEERHVRLGNTDRQNAGRVVRLARSKTE